MLRCNTKVTNHGYPGQNQSLQNPWPRAPGTISARWQRWCLPSLVHSVSWTQRQQEALLPWTSVTEQGPGNGNLCCDPCIYHPKYSFQRAKRDRLRVLPGGCSEPQPASVNLPSEGAQTPTSSACRPQHSYHSHGPAAKRWTISSGSEAAASSHHLRQRSRYVVALTHSLLASHFVPHLAPATTALRLM